VSVQTGRSQGSPLHANTRAIQMRNDIEVADPAAPLEAWELFDGASNWGCRFRSW
jgi:hypothetical protein